ARPRLPAMLGLALLVQVALGLHAASPARAQSSYEDERLERVLETHGLERVDDAERRPITKVHLVRHDVFVEDEMWPTFLNVFHALSHEDVITRELLFAVGDPYDSERIQETTRALRDQGIFAFVRIVPVRPRGLAVPADPTALRPTDPAPVEVLVFTRDLWSLRLESSFSFNDGRFDRLSLTLIERNLLGRNVQAAVSFDLLPMTWSLGGSFVDRRILSSRLSLSASMALVFTRESSDLEGSYGSLSFGLPLWDLRERWGFSASVSWNETVARQLSGTRLLTYDDPATPTPEAVQRIWYQDLVAASLTASRQLVTDDLIHRLTFGYAASVRRFEPHPDTNLAAGSELERAFIEDVLPPTRDQLYPYLRWQLFTPTWQTFTDLAAFGLSEDVRAGLGLDLALAFPLEAFGSDVDAMTFELGLTATLADAPHGVLVDLFAGLYGRIEASELIDQLYRVRLRGASPRLFFGRLVFSADVESRVADTAQTLVTLGGDNGLRGYPSQYFYAFGGDRLRLNLEARTMPLVIGSVHLGGVLFFDAGGVASSLAHLELSASLGLGLRALLPQFNRFAFRFDLGFPMSGGFTALVSFGSSQMVPLTALEDDKLSQ
ncbi:MAG TPA: hypothetical protein PK095_16765, partial [Myxococcota bacterium]|nr:hypothetical protein [Myxococcota bacterium]